MRTPPENKSNPPPPPSARELCRTTPGVSDEVPPRARRLQEGRTLRVACFAERLRQPLRAPPRADSTRWRKEGSFLSQIGYSVRKERLGGRILCTPSDAMGSLHTTFLRAFRAGWGQLLPSLPTCIRQFPRWRCFPNKLIRSCVRRIIPENTARLMSDVCKITGPEGLRDVVWLVRSLTILLARKTFLACDPA